jgi:transcriptional regulator GlxA family with amidase domain
MQVGLIVPHGFQLLSLAPLATFEMTAFESAKPQPTPRHYELHLLSEHGCPVRSSCGLAVETKAWTRSPRLKCLRRPEA